MYYPPPIIPSPHPPFFPLPHSISLPFPSTSRIFRFLLPCPIYHPPSFPPSPTYPPTPSRILSSLLSFPLLLLTSILPLIPPSLLYLFSSPFLPTIFIYLPSFALPFHPSLPSPLFYPYLPPPSLLYLFSSLSFPTFFHLTFFSPSLLLLIASYDLFSS